MFGFRDEAQRERLAQKYAAHKHFRGKHNEVLLAKPILDYGKPESTSQFADERMASEHEDSESEKQRDKTEGFTIKKTATGTREAGHNRQYERECVVVLPATEETRGAYRVVSGALVHDHEHINQKEVDTFHHIITFSDCYEVIDDTVRAQSHELEAANVHGETDSPRETNHRIIEPSNLKEGERWCYPRPYHKEYTLLPYADIEANTKTAALFDALGMLSAITDHIKAWDSELFPMGVTRSFNPFLFAYVGEDGKDLDQARPLASSFWAPTEVEVKKVYCLFRAIHPRLHHESQKSLKVIRNFMLAHLKWRISKARLEAIVGRQLHFCSFGMLASHYTAEALDKEQDSLNDLFPKNTESTAEKPKARRADMTPQDRKDYDKYIRDVIRRNQARRPVVTREDKLKQNNDVTCRVLFNEQEQYHSSAVIKVRINEIDETRHDQPHFVVELHYDHTNLRSQPIRLEEQEFAFEPSGKEYHENWHIEDCSDAKYDTLIAALTHKKCQWVARHRHMHEGSKRYIIQLPVNGRAITRGIFTAERQDTQHETVKSLRQCAVQPGNIYIVVQDSGAEEHARSLQNEISIQAVSDPLRDFCVDPQQRNLSKANLKDPSVGPLFNARVMDLFTTADQWRIAHAVALTYDDYSCRTSLPYHGNATCIPVKDSYDEELQLPMVYEVSVSLDHDERKMLPKLSKGTRGRLTFAKHVPLSMKGSWSAEVIEIGAEPGLERTTLYIKRPKDKQQKHGFCMEDPGNITLAEMETAGDIMAKIKDFESQDIVFFADKNDDRELKRSINGITSTIITKKDGARVAESKRMGMEVCKGTNDHLLPRTSLWETIDPTILPAIKDWAYSRLMPHQKSILEDLENDGIIATMVVLNGYGGGGKTDLAGTIGAAYTASVRVDESYVQWHETKHEQRKEALGKSHATSKAKQRTTANDPASKEPASEETASEEPAFMSKIDVPFLMKAISRPPPERKSDGQLYTPGQILTTSTRNSVTDNAFLKVERIINHMRKTLGLPAHLGIRIHAPSSERDIARASLGLSSEKENIGQQTDQGDLETQLAANSNIFLAVVRNNFIRHFKGTKWVGVRDSRVQLLENSLAQLALELTSFRDRSEGILNAFSKQELDKFATMMEAAVDAAVDDLKKTGTMSRDSKAHINTILRYCYFAILARAHHVGTTISNAQSKLVASCCNFSGIFMDEAGMVSETYLPFLFGLYPFADARIFAGDLNQTGPLAFGNPPENPFFQLLLRSILVILAKRRWPIHEMKVTSRFQTDCLLKLARLVSRDENLEAAPISNSDEFKIEQVKRYISTKYGKSYTVLFVNLVFARGLRMADSWVSPELIVAAVNAAVDTVEHCPTVEVAMITSYRVVKVLLSAIIRSLVFDYHLKGDKTMQRLLSRITVATTDEFQGHEAELVIYVGSAEGPTAFTYEDQRTTVYLLRAKIALLVFQKAIMIGKHPDQDSTIARFAAWCASPTAEERIPRMYEFSRNEFDGLNPLDDILEQHGLSSCYSSRSRKTTTTIKTGLFFPHPKLEEDFMDSFA